MEEISICFIRSLFFCDMQVDQGAPTYSREGMLDYYFSWTTKYACPLNGGRKVGKQQEGLSGGAIILIVLLVCVVVYLVGGVLVNRYVRHKEGPDLLPNREFWIMLPGLVKDGCYFTYTKIRGQVDSNYRRV